MPITRRARGAAAGTAASVACALGCASYSDALARGQRYYEDNQYERALALWRDLDRREAEFEGAERARYAYLRGMTDYRLGYADDARHWLAIARAADAAHPGGLGTVWLGRLDRALVDLGLNPSRGIGEGADAVQTIEAFPGAAGPGSSESNAPDANGPASRDLSPGGARSGVKSSEPATPLTPESRLPGGPGVQQPGSQQSGSDRPAADAGTSPAP